MLQMKQRRKQFHCNHKHTLVWTFRHPCIHSSYSTRNLVQTHTHNRCHFAFFFSFPFFYFFAFFNYVFFFVQFEPMLSKSLEVYEWQNYYKKFHITLLALLLIQVFVSFHLYNFDMFMRFYRLGNSWREGNGGYWAWKTN